MPREDVSHEDWVAFTAQGVTAEDGRSLEVGGYKAPPSGATTSYARPTARRFSGFAADPGLRTAGGQTIVIHGADLGPRANASAAAALPGASGAGSGSDGRGVRSPVSAAYQVVM